MRFDLHIHSIHSPDSKSTVKDIVNRARACGLDGISITDHNSFNGSKEALGYSQGDFVIIPGAEYSTDQGHFLVYFLEEGLEGQGLSRDDKGRFHWQDIVEAAHEQGAAVFIAHPFKPFRAHDPGIWEHIDGIEIYNSRASLCRNLDANSQAIQALHKYGKAFSAGSDAHWLGEIGHAFWECTLPAGREGENILISAKSALLSGTGKVWGSPTNRLYEPASQILKSFKTSDCRKALKPLIKAGYSCILESVRFSGLGKKAYEGWVDLKIKKGG